MGPHAGHSYLIASLELSYYIRSALAQGDGDSTAWGTSSSARTIAGAIIGVLLGLLVLTFGIVVFHRHQRVYGRPQFPSVELRRVSSYVSMFARRQNAELGANDQGPGYSAPPYSTQPPPYHGPGVQNPDPKQDVRVEAVAVAPIAGAGTGGLGYDVAALPMKKGANGRSVDMVDAEGKYEYDMPPLSLSTGYSSTPPPPTAPFDEPNSRRAWYKGYP